MQYEKLVLDKDGNIQKIEFVVEGRKQPLEEIHKKRLKLHGKFMRIKSDEFYDEMPREQVVSTLKESNEYDENDGLTKIRKKMKKWNAHVTCKYGMIIQHWPIMGTSFSWCPAFMTQLCILQTWSNNWKQGRGWMFRQKWRNQKSTLLGDAVAVIQNNLPM